MLFAALAGRPPFIGDVRSVVTGHLSGDLPSLARVTGLPVALDRVLARGMATDPSDRYPRAGDLIAAARDVLAAAGRAGSGPAPGSTAEGRPRATANEVFGPPARAQPARHRLTRRDCWFARPAS